MSGVVEVKVVYGTGWEGLERQTLYIDGREVMTVGPLCECPEDATLERSLKGPDDFVRLLKKFLIDHRGKQVRFVEAFQSDEEEEE